MKKIAIGIAVSIALIGASAVASAQSTESQSTGDVLRRLEASSAALAKENAALRERIKLSEEENAKLRDRVSQLKSSNQTAAATTSALPSKRVDPKHALHDKASSSMLVTAPPPAPVYNRTGWYVGVNGGASFGNVKTDFNVTPFVVFNVVPFSPAFAGSDRRYPDSFIGGEQIGYNWQVSPIWVLGLEADFQGALEKDSQNLSNPYSFPPEGITGTQVTNYTTQLDWFGTVRGRLGYVWWNGQMMSYITGGLAYGEVKINGTSTVTGSFGAEPVFSVAQAFDHSQVNTGWVVGVGTEGVIDFWDARHWTWKVEGLYMDLGTLDATGVTTGTSLQHVTCLGVPVCPLSGGQVATHSHFTDGILRVGLNYQFH